MVSSRLCQSHFWIEESRTSTHTLELDKLKAFIESLYSFLGSALCTLVVYVYEKWHKRAT